MLHRVEGERPQPEGVPDGCVHLLLGEGLQQPEHLHELPFATPAHSGLHEAAQRGELLGEIPALQGCSLVQGADLLLQERQVVDGVVVPRQLELPDWRQSVLPVHLLSVTTLLGRVGAVAGHVEFKDDGVMHAPVNGRRGGHGIGEDELPL